MKEIKNIDKLFQEKFKDFEAAPNHDVWPALEARLKEKRKRRMIPLWWKLSGIAAALLIGATLYNETFNRNYTTEKSVVIKEANDQNRTANPTKNELGSSTINDSTVTQTEQSFEKTETGTSESIGSSDADGGSISKNESVPDRKSSLVNADDTDPKSEIRKGFTSPNRMREVKAPSNIISSGKIVHLSNRKNRNVLHKTATESITKIGPPQDNAEDEQSSMDNNSYVKETESAITQESKTDPNLKLLKKSITPAIQNEKSNPEVIAESTTEGKKLDSTAIATVVPNALEELLNEKENNLVTKEPHVNRWQITSSVAPIYFGSASGGSPIDSTFSGNSKDYKTNLSVGVGVNYAINRKLSIRTGISQVTLNYNTNDVLMYTGLHTNSMGNVTLAAESQFLHFGNKSSIPNLVSGAEELSTSEFESYINQRMGYIEVPLELSYSLINKKIGVDIIGGISTLFLNENKIVVVTSGLTSNLGEANNLNKTHFSSNIGLGLKYRFFRSFLFNFEPMFKYQLNTFSKDAGNFKPYYFGLYTGLSYRF